MLNSQDWPLQYDSFMFESQTLLNRCEECLAHLEMIGDDEDAVLGLQTSLQRLGDHARQASAPAMAALAEQLHGCLDAAHGGCLGGEARSIVRSCLALLAWQLELIDPGTGELPMDDGEQQELLERLVPAISQHVTDP